MRVELHWVNVMLSTILNKYNVKVQSHVLMNRNDCVIKYGNVTILRERNFTFENRQFHIYSSISIIMLMDFKHILNSIV